MLISCQPDQKQSSLSNFQIKFSHDVETLLRTVERHHHTTNIDTLRSIFTASRRAFKRTEPALSFFKSSSYKALNMPNLTIVHEGDNGIEEEPPQGFQVLEEELFSDDPDLNKIKTEFNNIYNTVRLLRDNSQLVNIQNYHILWMVRAQLFRTMSLGITGFDSPVTLNSILENQLALAGTQHYLSIFEDDFENRTLYDRLHRQLEKAQLALEGDFNHFDRYHFIKDHLQPLLITWKDVVKDWSINFPLETKLNYEAESFFADNTFNTHKFAPRYSKKANEELVDLGRDLFNDNSLSGVTNMSCSSCHQANNYFVDGLKTSQANDGTFLNRNSPTLLYAALQNAQFYDARVSNLENQIIDVVRNEKEFHSSTEQILSVVELNSDYLKRFSEHYDDGVTSRNVRNAIAQYIRSLTPFNSQFDRNMQGYEISLTSTEIAGFNLFMGKAACGTCHFAPVFNGTVPPEFSHTELEVLGTPSTAIWTQASIDPDKGRYELFQANERLFSFKTPTVRNIAKTAPYMHNGIYDSLEEVVKFYNSGGGTGIGINLPNQTLPPDPLNLSEKEMDQIVAFLETLTDDIQENQKDDDNHKMHTSLKGENSKE